MPPTKTGLREPELKTKLVRLAFAEIATGAMVSVKLPVPEPPALVAVRVTEAIPEALGVPEMIPLAVSTLRPAGRLVAP